MVWTRTILMKKQQQPSLPNLGTQPCVLARVLLVWPLFFLFVFSFFVAVHVLGWVAGGKATHGTAGTDM